MTEKKQICLPTHNFLEGKKNQAALKTERQRKYISR